MGTGTNIYDFDSNVYLTQLGFMIGTCRDMEHTSTQTQSTTRVNGTRTNVVAGDACTTPMAPSMRASGMTMNAAAWAYTDSVGLTVY